MSVATIASLRAAAEAQKASAERALRNLDEIEARGDTDDDASEELESLASTMAKELGGVVESWRGAAEGNKPREMVGVGLMMTSPPVPGEAMSSAPQAASAAQAQPAIRILWIRLILAMSSPLRLLPGLLRCGAQGGKSNRTTPPVALGSGR